MGNILAKAIKVTRKGMKAKTRLLYPAGIKAYLLKREGRTQRFLTYAIFEYFGVEFDSYRTSERIEFAVLETDTFTREPDEFTMRQLAKIATHIALVKPSGESIVYEIRTGDEFQPFYLDFTFKFYVTQTGDVFDPSENQ